MESDTTDNRTAWQLDPMGGLAGQLTVNKSQKGLIGISAFKTAHDGVLILASLTSAAIYKNLWGPSVSCVGGLGKASHAVGRGRSVQENATARVTRGDSEGTLGEVLKESKGVAGGRKERTRSGRGWYAD